MSRALSPFAKLLWSFKRVQAQRGDYQPSQVVYVKCHLISFVNIKVNENN